MRQESAGRMNHAPEIDIEQPLHLSLLDLVKLAEQRHAGIVDEDVQSRMRGNGCFGKIGDLGSIADIGAVNAHFSSACLCDLGGDARKACFVAIGERKIRATRGEFDRKRTAYAAGRTGDGGSGSLDRGHWLLRLEEWIVSFVRLCRARCKGPRARRHSS